ncbi:thrombospondin type-1 domain-containing protein 1 [Etheostoma cragini]|uniref:thrombospondin type-1 domain-containing protein 1 n=1 Tax=Etheostoma cragini TaxID=417921 RepID=UPI00155ED317|nr:thrombospondin type-1 domain-containing protein 1 [Etheostoma cragini]XP_034746953.1 thrombospondin type-1 domain-containing protein 1 [Etheostoma cragini]
MPQAVSLLPFLLALMGYSFAGLNIWPSFHVALSNASVFVEFSTRSNSSTISNTSLSLVNTETNTTLLTRTLPYNQSAGRVEFNCTCFLYAGTFRFLLRQTSISAFSRANGTHDSSTESTTWWWSSELQVQWPTFHIAVDRAGNHSGSFQVGISTNEHFQACSSGIDSALFLEVSYMEYNQIGRNSIDKVQARTRHPIKPLRSQSVELSCAFPFTERDFIRVALRSPHSAQDVKSSGPLYLSRIFSYKLMVENTHVYRSACEGTMTVKLITPPCANINGKVMLYKDVAVGRGVAVSSGMEAGGTAVMEFGADEPSSPLLAFNWLTQGENETEFNCSVFYPGRNKYCFRFVFNFSRSPSPAQTCLVVHRSVESWGPWLPWSVCSVSCGEGVRERVRECLLPSGVGGMQCTGMVKEQSLCSLEDCVVLPSPSLPTVAVRVVPIAGNMVVVAGISLCLAVILATVVVTLWRKLCKTPQCSSVHRGSMHSPGGRKLSDEASICGHSLQRPSLSDGHGPPGGMGVDQKDRPFLGPQPLSQSLVIPLSQDPERLSPTGQKMLPPIFGYRLAQQQLKEMKKKGLKEATLLYHVSSSPVHDTVVETSASPTNSPIPAPTGFTHLTLPLGLQDDANHNHFSIAEPPAQTSRVTPDRLSPRVELVLGPSISAHASGGSSKWLDRTADWVEMVERSKLTGFRGGGDAGMENSYHKNPNFRRTSSFNDTKPQPLSAVHSRQFRERSMTQVGSRTLPEGSCWNKAGRERQPYSSYPIPEYGFPEWAISRPQRNDRRKPWIEKAAPSPNNELKHTGTNTNSMSASEKHAKANLSDTGDRQRSDETGGVEGISGIGGPATGPASLSVDRTQRAEQNWNRRGPSPIQRNILARKLKEAQSCSGVKGRQRSSTFSVSHLEQRKSLCHSLPVSGGCSSSGGSPYRLSEAEQRMLDLDLSAYVGEEE